MTRARSDGFSLVELLVVVGLISVLSAVTVPSIAQGMRQYRLNSAMQEVAGTIRTARYQAVGRNVTLRVRFNFPAAGQYQVLDTADAAVGNVKVLPGDTAFGEISGDIAIDPRGRVTALSGALPATIDVAHASDVEEGIDGDTRTISVTSSGRVQLP